MPCDNQSEAGEFQEQTKSLRSIVNHVVGAAHAQDGRSMADPAEPSWFDELAEDDPLGPDAMLSCLAEFDRDGDGALSVGEFQSLCQALFRPYSLPVVQLLEIFFLLDRDRDGRLDHAEFAKSWDRWLRPCLRPVSALVVVDVQNDFISGSLAISDCPAGQDGAEVVPVINKMLEEAAFNHVVYSLDWHPEDHVSFVENVTLRELDPSSPVWPAEDAKVFDTVIFKGDTPPQRLWPRHCVQGTWGAELHPDMTVSPGALRVYKGTNPDIDSYSAFWDNAKRSATPMNDLLQERGITDLFVCGLAYDVCVGSTARHALELGYRTTLVHDASRGVTHEDMAAMRSTIRERHGVVVDSENVPAMASGRDRRPELAYHYALTHLAETA